MRKVKFAESVAVVVPVHNREHLVVEALDSIAAQRYSPAQLIVVDNNSTDGTLAALRRWAAAYQGPMKVSVISEPLPGACAARNAGLELVEADWVMFFDSDDLMMPDHVERALATAAAHPGAKIVGWPLTMIDGKGHRSVKPFAAADALFHCVMHGTMATQRYMARPTLVKQAGGWGVDVMAWNDIELGVRMLRLVDEDDIVAVDAGKPTVLVRSQANSISGTGFSHRADAKEHSLDCIAANLPEELQWIVPLKRAILAARCRRESRADLATSILAKAKAAARSGKERLLFNAAYAYTAAGGRGAARLLRPFF